MKTLLVVLLLCIIGFGNKAIASPRPPSPPGLQKKAPINSGLIFLTLLGVVYGVKKISKVS
ncbi:hypothetical protein GGR97_001900 [Wenyingzhuangia aestuarii]|nr:hypothetical protein [Wenyingzhuangia aestuarii]